MSSGTNMAAKIREALVELVACKDLEDKAKALAPRMGAIFDSPTHAEKYDALMDQHYEREGPAWAAARDALLGEPSND